jgi:hypothetical protein
VAGEGYEPVADCMLTLSNIRVQNAENYVDMYFTVGFGVEIPLVCHQGKEVKYFLIKQTPWSRVILEKLIIGQLAKKFPAFYGTRRFNTVRITGLLDSVHRHPTGSPGDGKRSSFLNVVFF